MERKPDSPAAPTPAPASPLLTDQLLARYGARLVTLSAGDILFEEGEAATDFHVLQSGRIRMVSSNEKGREFTQGWFEAGQSFGEPPVFNGAPYPARAEAEVDSRVWKCPRAGFFRLLREHPEVHLELTRALSKRLLYKALMLGEIAIEEAEHRLVTLFGYLARLAPAAPRKDFRIPFTRQQLADMTGLRVETVIRAVKTLESRGALTISRGRIVWPLKAEPSPPRGSRRRSTS